MPARPRPLARLCDESIRGRAVRYADSMSGKVTMGKKKRDQLSGSGHEARRGDVPRTQGSLEPDAERDMLPMANAKGLRRRRTWQPST